ncbi:MAG: ATP-binding cassette subfamily F protein uup, partial [Oceanospirillaceae bacterium]
PKSQKTTEKNIKNVTLAAEKAPVVKKLSYKLQLELEKLPKQLEQAEQKVEKLQAITTASEFYQSEHSFVAEKLAELAAAQLIVEQLMDRWVELEA